MTSRPVAESIPASRSLRDAGAPSTVWGSHGASPLTVIEIPDQQAEASDTPITSRPFRPASLSPTRTSLPASESGLGAPASCRLCAEIAHRDGGAWHHRRGTTDELERGHGKDLLDAGHMLRDGLIKSDELLRLLTAIEPELYRFPAVDPHSFRSAVVDFAESG